MPDGLRIRLADQLWPIVEGAKHCVGKDLRSPALILVYSGIDIAGWIHSRKREGGSSREAFTAWVDRYLEPERQFGCSSLDLWGARCGLLHRSSPDSHWSESDEVRRILYSWGEAEPEDLERAADELHPDEYEAIHVEELVEGFRLALMSFLDEVRDMDTERREEICAKSRRIFIDTPEEPLQAFLTQLDGRREPQIDDREQ